MLKNREEGIHFDKSELEMLREQIRNYQENSSILQGEVEQSNDNNDKLLDKLAKKEEKIKILEGDKQIVSKKLSEN